MNNANIAIVDKEHSNTSQRSKDWFSGSILSADKFILICREDV